ncbi:hypothetical protein J6590_091928, partial [Homalodisca vitripennis]
LSVYQEHSGRCGNVVSESEIAVKQNIESFNPVGQVQNPAVHHERYIVPIYAKCI